MQKIWQFLVSGFTILLVSAAAHVSVAQTNTPPSIAETRLITLGTVAGPPPRPHRAQFSNLLIVNGTLYVIDAGDGVTRRIAKAGFNVRDVGSNRTCRFPASGSRARLHRLHPRHVVPKPAKHILLEHDDDEPDSDTKH